MKKWNLKVHIQSTHHAKKYVCGEVDLALLNRVEGWNGLDACGRALSTKGSLENHIRRVHLGMGQRRSRTKKHPTSDSMRQNLMKLTGAGYGKESGRSITCLLPDCDFRFGRIYDLRVHLVSHHKTSKEDAKEAVLEVEGYADPPNVGDDEGLPLDLPDDIDPRDWQTMNPDVRESDPMDTEGFWVGEGPEHFRELEDDTWFRDEMEMRMLIDGEEGAMQGDRGFVAPIDPLLQ
ncbi:MAG: hypothetical protein Q9218_000468 [Villophora microphyllina]